MTNFKKWLKRLTPESLIINARIKPEIGMECDICPALSRCEKLTSPVCANEFMAWAKEDNDE